MEAATAAPPSSNGEPPEDLPGEAPDEQAPEATQLSIEGDADVKLHIVGGRAPDQCTLRIDGGEIRVEGAVKKGDRVRLLVEGSIRQTHFIDLVDSKTREVVGTKRKHVMVPDAIARFPQTAE